MYSHQPESLADPNPTTSLHPPPPQVSAVIELRMNSIYTLDSVNKLQQQNRVAKGVRFSQYVPSGKISQFPRSSGLTQLLLLITITCGLRSGKQEWTVCGPAEHVWCGPDLGNSNFAIREA